MTAGKNGKKISPHDLVKSLVEGFKKNQYTIRVGDTKIVYIINRLFPKLAFGLVNPKKSNKQLQA